MANYKYYLGPWQRVEEVGHSYWSAPVGTVGLVDLRGLIDCGRDEIGDFPYGFFSVDPAASLDSSYVLLGQGDLRELQPSAVARSAWQSLLGQSPIGTTLVDWLWGQLTSNSDTTYDGPTPPLMPTCQGRLEIHLAGHSVVKQESYSHGSHPHSGKVEEVLRRQFRDNWERNQGQSRRVLDYWLEKYRLSRTPGGQDWRRFVPPDLRSHVPGPLPHSTTITDDFNRADTTGGLGSSSEGWSWANVSPGASHGIESGQAYADTGFPASRAETDLSSEDHYVYTLANNVNSPGPCCRFRDSALTFYYLRRSSSSSIQFFKVVNGSFTSLGTRSESSVQPQEFKLTCDGSTHTPRVAGADLSAFTDSAISGYLRTGLRSGQTGSGRNADDFEAADLAATGGGSAAMLLNGGLINRGLVCGGLVT